MASNYAGFAVQKRDADGVLSSVGAGVSVVVYNVTTGLAVAESPLTTDSQGEIIDGSLAAVAAGTRIRFRVANFEGLAGSETQVTT